MKIIKESQGLIIFLILLLNFPLKSNTTPSITCSVRPVVDPNSQHVSTTLQESFEAPSYETPNGLPNGEISLYTRFKLQPVNAHSINIIQVTGSISDNESFSILRVKHDSNKNRLSVLISNGNRYRQEVEFEVSALKVNVFYFMAIALNLEKGILNVFFQEDENKSDLKGKRFSPEILVNILKKMNEIPQEISKIELFTSKIPAVENFPQIKQLTFWPGCTEHFPAERTPPEIIPLDSQNSNQNSSQSQKSDGGFTSCSNIVFSHFEFILQFFDHPELVPVFSSYKNQHADFLLGHSQLNGKVKITPIQASVFPSNQLPFLTTEENSANTSKSNSLSFVALEDQELVKNQNSESQNLKSKMLKNFPISQNIALFFELKYSELMNSIDKEVKNEVLLAAITNLEKRAEISIYIKPQTRTELGASGFKLEVISRHSDLSNSESISISLPNSEAQNSQIATRNQNRASSTLNILPKSAKFGVYVSSYPEQNSSTIQLIAFNNPESQASNSVFAYKSQNLDSSSFLVEDSTIEFLGSDSSSISGFGLQRLVVSNSLSHMFKTMLSSNNSVNKDMCTRFCFLPAYQCDALNPIEMGKEKRNLAKSSSMNNLNRQLKKKMGFEIYDSPTKCWLCPADHVFNPESGKCEIFCHFETKNVGGTCISCTQNNCEEISEAFQISLKEIENSGGTNPVLEAIPSKEILFFGPQYYTENFDLYVSENGQGFTLVPFDAKVTGDTESKQKDQKQDQIKASSGQESDSQIISSNGYTKQRALIYVGYSPGSMLKPKIATKEALSSKNQRILQENNNNDTVVTLDSKETNEEPQSELNTTNSQNVPESSTTDLTNDTIMNPNQTIEISPQSNTTLTNQPQSRVYQLRLKPNRNGITASRNLIPREPFTLTTPSAQTASNPLIDQMQPVQDLNVRNNPTSPAYLLLPQNNPTALNRNLRINPKFETCVGKVNDKLLKRLALSLFILVCIASLAFAVYLFVTWNVKDIFQTPYIVTHLYMALIFLFHAAIFSQFYNFPIPPSLHVFLRHLYYYSIRWHGAFRIPALNNHSDNSDFMADYNRPFIPDRSSLSIVGNIFLNYGVIMLILFVLFVVALILYFRLINYNKLITLSLQNWVEFLHESSARYMLSVSMHLFIVSCLIFSSEVCFFFSHQFAWGNPKHSLFVASLVFAVFTFIFHTALVFLVLALPFYFTPFIGKKASSAKNLGSKTKYPNPSSQEGQTTHFKPPANSLVDDIKDTANEVKETVTETFKKTTNAVKNLTGLNKNSKKKKTIIPRSKFYGSIHMYYPHENSMAFAKFRALYPFLFIIQGLRKGPIGHLVMGISSLVFSIYGVVIGAAYKYPRFSTLFNLILVFLLFCYILYASPGFNAPSKFLLYLAYFIFFAAHLLLTILAFDPSSLANNNGIHYCRMADAIIALFYLAVALLIIGLIISMFMNEKNIAPLDIFGVKKDNRVRVGTNFPRVGVEVTRKLESDDHISVAEEDQVPNNLMEDTGTYLRRPSHMISDWKSELKKAPLNTKKMKNENLEMIRSDVLRINQSTKRIETNISKFNKKYELSAIPQIEPEIEEIEFKNTPQIHRNNMPRDSIDNNEIKSEEFYVTKNDDSDKNSISPIPNTMNPNELQRKRQIDSADRRFKIYSPDETQKMDKKLRNVRENTRVRKIIHTNNSGKYVNTERVETKELPMRRQSQSGEYRTRKMKQDSAESGYRRERVENQSAPMKVMTKVREHGKTPRKIADTYKTTKDRVTDYVKQKRGVLKDGYNAMRKKARDVL